ncbi:MAG TPA: response regulator [Chloroflexia bacterium]|nr:response regulator [Chloroflexia bacterium]
MKGLQLMEEQEIFQSAQILIVDDQEANVRLLDRILKRAGYTSLVSTTDSREVATLFTKFQPDLILLDLMMPHLDGFQVLELLRPLIPAGSYLPILVLTADVSGESKQRALSIGARDFVTKPFDPGEVLLRIKNLLETRFLHLQLQEHNQLLEGKVRERTQELTHSLHRLMNAQETERRRLSMDIHDGPLQHLGLSIMASDRIIQRKSRGEYELIEGELHALKSSIRNAIDDLRAILGGMSIEILKSYGLVSALQHLIDGFASLSDLSVTFEDGTGSHLRFPSHIELLMYRLAQEAFANIRKHTKAREVILKLAVEDDRIHMMIRDDGDGFNVGEVMRQRRTGEKMGLKSMQQRIRQAQGDMAIESSPGNGTMLTFWCSMSANHGEGRKNRDVSTSAISA